jgi:ureidoacrylate peracid hydrolase
MAASIPSPRVNHQSTKNTRRQTYRDIAIRTFLVSLCLGGGLQCRFRGADRVLTQQDENRLFEKLWKAADEAIRERGRPQHVYAIDKEKAVLIVIDMQNFVCEPRDGHGMRGLAAAIASINSLVDFFHRERLPVIWIRQSFTADEHGNDAGLYCEFHRKPLSPEVMNLGHGTEVNSRLHFDRGLDYEVLKNRYSAFAGGSSKLKGVLGELGRTQLVVAGAATNVCVESTVRDAMQMGYEVVVVGDATAAADRMSHEVSLMNIRQFFGDVRNAEDVIAELSAEKRQ